jgi:hypothetical protein
MSASRSSQDKERTISYRLGRPYVEQLEQAAKSHGMSPGQFARLVLVMHFEQTATHKVNDTLCELRQEVLALRAEVGLTAGRGLAGPTSIPPRRR